MPSRLDARLDRPPQRLPFLSIAALWPLLAVAGLLPTLADAPLPENHPVPRADGEVVIDGRLDEEAWRRALVVELGYETEPEENVAAPQRTSMLVTYDTERILVAFRAFDDRPGLIRAHLMDRDLAWSDDWVGIVLDSFNDSRRGFEFFANPLGVQMDLFIDDVSGNEDHNWDAIWDSAGRITEDGYVVEMGIPFSSITFPQAAGEQTWGFEGLRNFPRSERRRFRNRPRDRDRSCYICQFGKLTGFDGVSPGRNLEVVPTLTAGRSDRRDPAVGGAFDEGSFDTDPGLTVSWGVTPNLTLSGTLNPDFSQVEADSAQLDVNNQFALFFPEKRPFFLEGMDFLRSPLDVVHSRVVADPDWGVKLTGKQGKHGLGVMAARDTVTNFLIPGSQGSRLGSMEAPSTNAVVRYRRDLGESSSIGALATAREGEDGYYNRVAGVDGLWRFTDSDSVRFQALTSQSRYPSAIAEAFDQPRGELDDFAYVVRYRHSSRNWFAYLDHSDSGAEFRADLGFLPQVGRRLSVAGLERIFWPADGKDTWWTRAELGADYDVTVEQDGPELEREIEFWSEVQGPKQSYLSFRWGRRSRFFDTVEFEESFRQMYFEVSPTGHFSTGLFARRGDNIDFAGVRPGEQILLEPWLRWNAGRHLTLNLSHVHDRLDVDGGRLFTADLTELRLVYQFNRRSFLRLVSQQLDIERDPLLYADGDLDAEQRDLFNQLLFSYKLNPRTVLFLGYSDAYQANERLDLTQANRAVFMKIGYAWVL